MIEATERSRFGELDLHLFNAGRHHELFDHLGAHPDDDGTTFSVWAPNAQAVHVIGDTPGWSGAGAPLTPVAQSGIWEGFVADAGPGEHYRFRITTPDGTVLDKADPMAFRCDLPPDTASVVHRHGHRFQDDRWMAERAALDPMARPMSIYEVHLGSWRRDPADPDRELGYRESAELLAAYATDMGFTHVELMPVMAHPFAGSWGYQVTSYFAPSPKWGDPDDFAAMVDVLHQAGIGVLLDWVPAHFPMDDWALGRFDGTALYEHADPKRGMHPDWGTLEFNLGRHEVRNFLIANAVFWLERMHVDGLRVDAVASMLYLDYSREPGEWIPNAVGGREDLEAVSFLQELNDVVRERVPGAVVIAEESTAWPGVSRPASDGGLGFSAKWNMGWMHDTLGYFAEDPVNRRHHHDELTFSLVYAFTEAFVLPLSHDEVVHGKGSLLTKMPGDRWQQLANLRALFATMWAHPGKQLIFMGCELAQEREWSHERSLDWHLLERPEHRGVQALVRDLNHGAVDRPALWEQDARPEGFSWLIGDDADQNVIAFLRWGVASDHGSAPVLACIANLSPVPRSGYEVGLPSPGRWRVVLDSDAGTYGGSDAFAGRPPVIADRAGRHGQPQAAAVDIGPLAVLWLEPDPEDGRGR
ncbi:1,4-alpha-glucan branching protein GlgB [Aquihabitans daechungensis]|uniref:1,4-alpha-glucan branching protein GlgB n=1 Tax=Aquihabitans daechungensis TaxID=1052257 RepID=UPI003B9F851B